MHSIPTDNTLVGEDALANNTGAQNTALGVRALQSNTSGSQNTAAGVSALGSNDNGGGNNKDTTTDDTSTLPVGGVFVFIGFTPNSWLIKDHYEHDTAGYVITDSSMQTSIPGLFAAGDLRVQVTRQITTAVGDATTAVIAIEKYLKERTQEPVREPV